MTYLDEDSGKPIDAAADFHWLSAIEAFVVDSGRWREPWTAPPNILNIQTKTYPRLESVALESASCPDVPIIDALRSRRSRRNPTAEPLRSRDLATLLRLSFASETVSTNGRTATRRCYPSAGARFPLEPYAVVARCDSIEPGIYHLAIPGYELERIDALGDPEATLAGVFGYDWIASARAVVFLTAMLDRTMVKYGPRGYRYALLEAGHVMQTLCLVATTLDIALTPVGGFADKEAAQLLHVDPVQEPVLYAGVLP